MLTCQWIFVWETCLVAWSCPETPLYCVCYRKLFLSKWNKNSLWQSTWLYSFRADIFPKERWYATPKRLDSDTFLPWNSFVLQVWQFLRDPVEKLINRGRFPRHDSICKRRHTAGFADDERINIEVIGLETSRNRRWIALNDTNLYQTLETLSGCQKIAGVQFMVYAIVQAPEKPHLRRLRLFSSNRISTTTL